eukprot:Nitzschia sp. Nitz4//scaffold21_size171442//24428//27509//NITZ4_002145-RA/size171442-processed-gene-0.41-mRNA-1//-1//CDS//3329542363//9234//frame0
MSNLVQVIEGTLSPIPETRKAAEAHLTQLSTTPQHPLDVLRLIASADASSPPVRQAAAVHFKNMVKNGWDESKDAEDRKGVVISPADRNTIKENLVELMCTVPPIIQSQISESISLIADVDYPKNWQNLVPALVQKLNSPDMAVVNGVLSTANSIFKSFRYVQRGDELYEKILYTLKQFQEPLLQMFIQMGKAVEGYANDPQQLVPRFEALRLMCRIFFSLNFQDLPEFFEDHMKEWMDEFAKYLNYKNPLLVDDSEEDEPSPVDKLQTAIIQCLKLYSDKDEEPFIPFLPNFTTLVWNLLVSLTAYPKHDSLVTTSIKFLSSLVGKQMHSNLFQAEETLRQIVAKIVIPNMMVRESDEEKFEDDPQEYIMTEIEGSDSESRRKCSRDLLRDMCRQFEAQTTAICMEHISSMLAEFGANPSKWAAKDTAIHLMLGIAIRLESHRGVSELNPNVNLIEFFSSQVFPELQDSNHSNRPVVKATALKFVCTFRKQFTKEQLKALMPLMISHLSSPSVVVHTLAAYGIERALMCTEEETPGQKKIGKSDLTPLLETLFTGLFAIIDNTEWNENEHVMKCTMRTLARAGSDVIPVTGIVFSKLAVALERVCKNPRNPSYNHYLFESIAALVRNCCSVDASKTGELEQLLFPPFQTVLQMDILEFTPYVFQVLAQLLEYRSEGSGLGPAYTSLFPPLLTASLWEKRGNVPGLVRLLRAYLKRAAPELVESLVPMLGIFQSLNASKATEASAFVLLEALTTYIPEPTIGPHMKTIFNLIMRKLSSAKPNSKYPPLAISYFALFAGLFGGPTLLGKLNEIQSGVGVMILSQVWIPKISLATHDKQSAKTQVVGLTRVLCDTPEFLADDNGKQIWSQGFKGIVSVLSSQAFSSQSAVDLDDTEVEIGYDATYSQLRLAYRKPDDPFATIADPTKSFTSALESLSAQRPGVLGPIIQLSLGDDPKLAGGFQSMVQATGARIA